MLLLSVSVDSDMDPLRFGAHRVLFRGPLARLDSLLFVPFLTYSWSYRNTCFNQVIAAKEEAKRKLIEEREKKRQEKEDAAVAAAFGGAKVILPIAYSNSHTQHTTCFRTSSFACSQTHYKP